MGNAILSGLTVAQAGQDNVKRNIARLNDVNASRVIVTPTSNISSDGRFLGVSMQKPQRVENVLLAENIREQTVTANTSETLSLAHDRILQHLGQPGDQGSLGYKLTDFKNVLGLLEVTPGESSYQKTVVGKLSSVLERVSQFGDFCQSERELAEAGIANGVSEVNRILENLHKTNVTLRSSDSESPYSMDEQDKYLKELSSYLNIQVIRNTNDASVQVESAGGKALLLQTGPTFVEFTEASAISASLDAADLGKLAVDNKNLTEDLYGGSIGAHLKIRDGIFPDLQKDMDEFAFQLKEHLNAIHNQGSGFPPSQILEGTTIFLDTAGTDIKMSGLVRIGLIDRSLANQGVYASAPFDFDFTTATSIDDVVIALNTSFGADATAEITLEGALKITATNAVHGISIVSLGASESVDETTGKGFSHFFGLNDLILSQNEKVGMAQTMIVRPDIKATPQLFSRGELSTSAAVGGDIGLYVGGNSAVTKMMLGLENRLEFQKSGNLSGRREALTTYANSIYQAEIMEARNAQAASMVDANALQKKEEQHKNETGISIQEEIQASMDWGLMSNALTQVNLAQRKMLDNLVNSL